MLGRSKAPKGSNPLWGWRDQLLENPPPETATWVAPGTSTWGVLMEMGHAQGAVSLACMGDGSTSLYLPTGGGFIGAGGQPPIAAAAVAFVTTADALRPAFAPVTDWEFPSAGSVRFFVLTTGGVLTAEGDEQSVGNGHGPLSVAFHAGQAVITQLRLWDAQQKQGHT